MTANRGASARDGAHGGVAYTVVGERGPGVLLLHPAFTDARVFDGLVARLGDRYRFVVVDLPGHGRSARAAARARRSAPADAVAAIVGILDLEAIDATHLVGVSLGGLVAQEVARRFPSRVRSLTAVGTYPAGDPVAARAQRGEMLRWLPLLLFAMPRFRRYVARTSTATDAGRRRFLELAQGFARAGFAAMGELTPKGGAQPEGPSAWPLRIVVGEHDLPVVRDAALRWHEREPRSRFEEVAQAGHVVPLDAPEAFADALAAWIDEVEARRDAGGC